MGETAKQLRELRQQVEKLQAELEAVNEASSKKEAQIDKQLEEINRLQELVNERVSRIQKLEEENAKLIETANVLDNTLSRIRKLPATHWPVIPGTYEVVSAPSCSVPPVSA